MKFWMILLAFFFSATIAWEGENEGPLFLFSFIATCIYLYTWYKPIFTSWPKNRAKLNKFSLAILPIICTIINFFVLTSAASYDVEGIWVFFYILIGFLWMFFSLYFIQFFFNLYPFYDLIELNNSSAKYAFSGAFIGANVIYAFANIGDGPGWWVVFIAGFMGLLMWLLLGIIVESVTHITEKITVNRDIGAGIRFGTYLFSSSLIIGFASSGDWTSFAKTALEFEASWPVFILVLIYIIIELLFFSRYSKNINPGYISTSKNSSLFSAQLNTMSSIVVSIFYFLLSILGILLSYNTL